jgi:hypothetical protein
MIFCTMWKRTGRGGQWSASMVKHAASCCARLTPVRDNGLELVELGRPFGKGRQLQALELGGDGVGHG